MSIHASNDFVHEHLTADGRARAREYVHFVVVHQMPDVDTAELRKMLKDTELLDAIAGMGVCVSRAQVKTQIEATLSMRALSDDASVD